jgi:hypothetical protein
MDYVHTFTGEPSRALENLLMEAYRKASKKSLFLDHVVEKCDSKELRTRELREGYTYDLKPGDEFVGWHVHISTNVGRYSIYVADEAKFREAITSGLALGSGNRPTTARKTITRILTESLKYSGINNQKRIQEKRRELLNEIEVAKTNLRDFEKIKTVQIDEKLSANDLRKWVELISHWFTTSGVGEVLNRYEVDDEMVRDAIAIILVSEVQDS